MERDYYDEIRAILWAWQEAGDTSEYIEGQLDELKLELEE